MGKLLGAFLIVAALAAPALAEPYLDLGVGATIFSVTTPDGTWWQRPFPHHFDPVSVAGLAGVGWRFNERWSTEIAYLRLGTVKISAHAVMDKDYNPNTHQCLAHCDQSRPFVVRDTFQGGEWSVAYRPVVSAITESVLPFLKAGVAVMYHDLILNDYSVTTDPHIYFHGWVPMVLAGGGVCVRSTWPVEVCAEATYYHGIGSGIMGNPISTRAVVPMLSLTIQF